MQRPAPSEGPTGFLTTDDRVTAPSLTPIELAGLHRRAFRLEWLTTLWNVAEAVIAIGSGAVAGSSALVAFGIDSLIEVSSALVVLWRLFKAAPDASAEQVERADRRAHRLVGITFFVLAAYVAVDALRGILFRSVPEASPVGMALAVASLLAMPALAVAKQRTGRRMGSRALEADAMETWLCAYLSAALLIGLVLNAILGWWWADPVAALAMAPFMVWQGRRAILESGSGEQD
jgi:divalent metal cation (Fe/Co/Zn/Cd) transporter